MFWKKKVIVPVEPVVAVQAQPFKEFWEDDFEALKKVYPHGAQFAFSGCQLTVIGFWYATEIEAPTPGSLFTVRPRMTCVYRNSVGDLKEFVFTEHHLPLLLQKVPVK
jgi:hypothetical protein